MIPPEETPTPAPQHGPLPGPPRWRKVALRLVRLVFIGLVLYMGWQVAASYRELFSGPRSVEDAKLDMEEAALLAPVEMLASLPDAGPWTFAGVPWKMTIRDVPTEEVDTELVRSFSGGGKPVSFPGKHDPLKLLGFLRWKIRQDGPVRIHHHRGRDMGLAVALMEGGRGELLVGGRMAFPAREGGWRLLEIVPAEGSAPEGISALLPLPDTAGKLATRWTAKETVLAELWSLDDATSDWTDKGKAAGWAVREVQGHRPGRFLVFGRADETIGAWWMSSEGKRGGLLLLIRASAP